MPSSGRKPPELCHVARTAQTWQPSSHHRPIRTDEASPVRMYNRINQVGRMAFWCLWCVLTTRKPSWRKGKRVTAMRVWRLPAKKSRANQRYPISYWWLIVTVAVLLTVCEIFSRTGLENRHFRPLYCNCRTPSGGTPSNIDVIFTSPKCTFSELRVSSFVVGHVSGVLFFSMHLFFIWQWQEYNMNNANSSRNIKQDTKAGTQDSDCTDEWWMPGENDNSMLFNEEHVGILLLFLYWYN